MTAIGHVIEANKLEAQQALDDTKARLDKLSQELYDNVRKELDARTGSASSQGGFLGQKKEGIINLKDNKVKELPESVSKADFKKWRKGVEMFLDSVDDWANATALLRMCRIEPGELNNERVDEMIIDVNDAGIDTSKHISARFDVAKNSKDLYKYLYARIKKDLMDTADAIEENVLELWRQINLEIDPIVSNTGFVLRAEIQKLAFERQTTEAGTREIIKSIDRLTKEHLEKTGKKVDEVLPLTVIWGAMDQKSVDFLTTAGVVEDKTSYKQVKEKLAEKEKLEQGRSYVFRKAGSRKNGDQMDLSALQPRPEDDPEAERRRLDALGDQETCSKCSGKGHGVQSCPSWNGHATYTCSNCGGRGHYARECTSKGKGKGDKGKGKGKGDKGGWFQYGSKGDKGKGNKG